jgi:hypothetical protein
LEESSLDPDLKAAVKERVQLTLEIQRHKLKATAGLDDERLNSMQIEEQKRNKSHGEWLKKLGKKKAETERAGRVQKQLEI